VVDVVLIIFGIGGQEQADWRGGCVKQEDTAVEVDAVVLCNADVRISGGGNGGNARGNAIRFELEEESIRRGCLKWVGMSSYDSS
jgi:hypothetical protein